MMQIIKIIEKVIHRRLFDTSQVLSTELLIIREGLIGLILNFLYFIHLYSNSNSLVLFQNKNNNISNIDNNVTYEMECHHHNTIENILISLISNILLIFQCIHSQSEIIRNNNNNDNNNNSSPICNEIRTSQWKFSIIEIKVNFLFT